MNTTPRTCRICKKPLTGRVDRRYCSSSCRVIAWVRRRDRKTRHGLVLLALSFVLSGPSASASPRYASYYTRASVLAEGSSGITASGERYDESALTCALPRRDFGGFYRVCLEDHPMRCVVVRHNDYGPRRIPQSRGVVVDLTPTAFSRLADLRHGIIPVTIQHVHEAAR